MTGRAAGFCAGNGEAGWTTAPGFAGPRRGAGRGGRFGRGGGARFGRGWGPGYAGGPAAPGQPSKTELREAMGMEMDALERRLDALKRDMEALDAEKGSEDA